MCSTSRRPPARLPASNAVAPFVVQSEEEIREVLRVNTLEPMLLTRAFLPLLGSDSRRSGTPGRLVFVNSSLGAAAVPFFAAFCASKFALDGFATAVRRELAPLGVKTTSACAMRAAGRGVPTRTRCGPLDHAPLLPCKLTPAPVVVTGRQSLPIRTATKEAVSGTGYEASFAAASEENAALAAGACLAPSELAVRLCAVLDAKVAPLRVDLSKSVPFSEGRFAANWWGPSGVDGLMASRFKLATPFGRRAPPPSLSMGGDKAGAAPGPVPAALLTTPKGILASGGSPLAALRAKTP